MLSQVLRPIRTALRVGRGVVVVVVDVDGDGDVTVDADGEVDVVGSGEEVGGEGGGGCFVMRAK